MWILPCFAGLKWYKTLPLEVVHKPFFLMCLFFHVLYDTFRISSAGHEMNRNVKRDALYSIMILLLLLSFL